MAATSQSGPEKRARHPVLRLLKPLLAVVVLAVVFRLLPWTDRLHFTAPGGQVVEARGELVGDWKAAEVHFEVSADGDTPLAGKVLFAAREGAAKIPGIETSEELGSLAGWDPGMTTVFQSVEPTGVALAMGLFFVALLFGVTRWWRLLRLVGCDTTWWNAMRLTYLGLFFNLVMPGLTGGDVAKAVLVVREHPERRARALMSVIVDRLIGLGTLALLALTVILISGDTFAELRTPMLVCFALGVGGALAYFSKGLRRLVRLDELLAKLPLGDKLRMLDEAAQHYLAHPVELFFAVLLSLGNHTGAIIAVWALGRSFGVTAGDVSVLDYFAVVPVANIVSSIPISPSGWGVGEAIYIYLFELVGASASLGVAVSVSFRLCQLLLGLLGGLFLLAPGARAELVELEADVAEFENA